MAKANTDHLVVDTKTNQMTCPNCGVSDPMPCGYSLPVASAVIQVFGKAHRTCKDRGKPGVRVRIETRREAREE